MMRLLTLILLVLWAGKGFAQNECRVNKWLNPSPTSNNLNSIFFTSAQTGYAVGAKGTIIKTTDGGENWFMLNSGSSYELNSVWFTSSETGYIGGSVNNAGNISKTTDGGQTWTELISGLTPGPVEYLYFTSKDTGFAGCAFGKLYRTIDAGATWTSINVTGGGSATFKDIQFTTESTVFMTNDSKVFKSTDKGLTWTNTTLPGSSVTISSMHFPNKDTGYVTGGIFAPIFKTIDGGTTWTKLTTSGLYGTLKKTYFVSADTGYIATTDNNLFRTVNGGLTWALVPGNPAGSILSFYFVNNKLGYAAGNYGHLFRISENSFVKLHKGFSATFYEIDFTSDKTGYICGSGGTILKTTDRAKTWTPLTTGTTETLYRITFPDVQTGYAAGSNGSLLKTINGGTSWTKFTGGPTTTTFAMYFVNNSIGYRAGSGGYIFRTLDGGSNWTTLTSGVTTQLNDLYFIDADTGYAAGSGGIILKTKDKGATWTKLTTGTTNFIRRVYFINPLKGYAFGENGIFLTTENAGQTWTKTTAGWGDHIQDAFFYDETNAFFVTGQFNGTVYSTSDGTQTWQTTTLLNDGYLNGIYALTKDSLLVTGPSGLIVMVANYNPVQPTISISENTLTASDGVSYQWFKEGEVLAEETSQTYTVTSAGNYSVKVSDENGCSSTSEEVYADIVSGLLVSEKNDAFIFPNPVEHLCTIRIKQQFNSNGTIEITDITGKRMDINESDITTAGEVVEINTSRLSNGLYMLRISVDGTEYYGKFMKF